MTLLTCALLKKIGTNLNRPTPLIHLGRVILTVTLLILFTACGGPISSVESTEVLTPESSGDLTPDSTVAELQLRYPALEACPVNRDAPLRLVTYIGCVDLEDFSGFELFTNLKDVYLVEPVGFNFPEMESVEVLVIEFSPNTKLKSIDLSAFTNLRGLIIRKLHRSIEGIILSPNLNNMEFLTIEGSISEDFNLPELQNLNILTVASDGVESIDLSPLPNLRRLVLNGNQLTEMDLTVVPNLEIAYLENNQLTSIDITKTKKLKTLHLGGNPMYCSEMLNVHEAYSNMSVYEVFGDSVCIPDETDIKYDNFIPSLSFFDTEFNECIRRSGSYYLDEIKALTCNDTNDISGIEQLKELKHLHLYGSVNGQFDLLSQIEIEHLTLTNYGGVNLVFTELNRLKTLDLVNPYTLEVLDLTQSTAIENVTIKYAPNLISLNLEDNDALTELTLGGPTMLNLPSYKGLRVLSLHGESSDINYSDFLLLEELMISEYQNNALDLSSLSNLAYLSVRKATNLDRVLLPSTHTLENITLEGTSIESLDLSGRNTLTRLELSGNFLLEQVLFPSDPSALSEFQARDNKKLERVNLSQQSHLTSISMFRNNLTSIDLPTDGQLEYLSLTQTALTEINLSLSQQLSYLSLDENDFTSINLTENPNLNYLDLSDNPQLTSLNLSFNTALTKLYLNEMTLPNLDLSNNLFITDIELRYSDELCFDIDNIVAPLTLLDIENSIGCD